MRFWTDESGASAAEYALILAIVTGGITASVFALEGTISTALTNAANCIDAGNQGDPTLCPGTQGGAPPPDPQP